MTIGDRAVSRLREQMVRPALPPRYEPIEIVGRGGMGVVWRAHDHLLRRDVAVKVLDERVVDADLVARLAREAMILAQLEHPGTVAVHDTGMLSDGRTWYAMRLIVGTPLDAPDARPTSVGDVLRTMTRLSETIAFAHDRGILHRDLKPANVMVGPFGELLILDWGLARVETVEDHVGDPARGSAGHGMIIGTPGYMAPEQAIGGATDVRSDVYGLGAILRDLLVAWGSEVPRPLAAIRDRALASTPTDRYPSSRALGDDLRRYQDGAAVEAYDENISERLSRIMRPYWGAVALVAAYIVMRLVLLFWKGV